MGDQLQFILKIVVVSWLLSLIVKYGGQWFNPAPSAIAASIGVLAPTAVCIILLGWRSRSQN